MLLLQRSPMCPGLYRLYTTAATTVVWSFFPPCCSWLISVWGIALQFDYVEYRIILNLVRAVLFTVTSMILRARSRSPVLEICQAACSLHGSSLFPKYFGALLVLLSHGVIVVASLSVKFAEGNAHGNHWKGYRILK